MVSASWALWQITWAHRYSVFPGRVSRWKKYPANARWQQIANKMPCVFFIFSILVITYVTWTWHEQDGFEIDMTTHKGRETTLLTEQMLECFWIFFVHPWNFRMAKSVVNKCILVEGKITPHSLIPTSHEAQIHFFHFFELFAKELTQRLLGLGADFTQADSRVRREKKRAAGERLVKDDVFFFWGVGRPELDGYRPEISRNNIVYSRLILEKRCMYNIYIFIYTH